MHMFINYFNKTAGIYSYLERAKNQNLFSWIDVLTRKQCLGILVKSLNASSILLYAYFSYKSTTSLARNKTGRESRSISFVE